MTKTILLVVTVLFFSLSLALAHDGKDSKVKKASTKESCCKDDAKASLTKNAKGEECSDAEKAHCSVEKTASKVSMKKAGSKSDCCAEGKAKSVRAETPKSTEQSKTAPTGGTN